MPYSRSKDQPPLTNAERQARYRARHKLAQQVPLIRYRRPADRQSRPQRWLDYVNEMMNLHVYSYTFFDALPDAPRDTPTAMALQGIIDLDLFELAAIVPPRGFGRD